MTSTTAPSWASALRMDGTMSSGLPDAMITDRHVGGGHGRAAGSSPARGRTAGHDGPGPHPPPHDRVRGDASASLDPRSGQENRVRTQLDVVLHDDGSGRRADLPVAPERVKMIVHHLAERAHPASRAQGDRRGRIDGGAAGQRATVADRDCGSPRRMELDRRIGGVEDDPVAHVDVALAVDPDLPTHLGALADTRAALE